MQTADSQLVVGRFFDALYRLKADKVIRGKQTFTSRYGINRWNMNKLEKEKEMVGMYLSSHPLDDYYVEIKSGVEADTVVFTQMMTTQYWG